jgi:hypothetical protein
MERYRTGHVNLETYGHMTIAGTGHVIWKDQDRIEWNKSMKKHENDWTGQ